MKHKLYFFAVFSIFFPISVFASTLNDECDTNCNFEVCESCDKSEETKEETLKKEVLIEVNNLKELNEIINKSSQTVVVFCDEAELEIFKENKESLIAALREVEGKFVIVNIETFEGNLSFLKSIPAVFFYVEGKLNIEMYLNREELRALIS